MRSIPHETRMKLKDDQESDQFISMIIVDYMSVEACIILGFCIAQKLMPDSALAQPSAKEQWQWRQQ